MGLLSKKKPEQKINDLIFKELIKRGYSLEGNTRVWNIADSKLWYLTPEQAQAYLDLEKSQDYERDVIQKEIILINENIDEILRKVGNSPFNIIDLGCGDGKKAVLFINHLKGKINLRYCPVDISGYMVEKAITRIREIGAGEVVQFQWNISDFENIENIASLLRQGKYKSNLYLLLGNTLGNFEINELLYEIRSSMKEGDLLLIGNGLDNRNVDEIIKSYYNPEVNNFLKRILLQVGLEEDDIKLGVRFKNSRVELYYTLLKEKRILFQDKAIGFSRGDQIIVAISYKYDKNDFMTFLNIHFNDVMVKTSKDKSYALALCKK
jgi:uncharacterized SAM-dependent methyltransferase